MIRRLLFALLLLFFATPSWAATYYVTKSGSNANTCGQAQVEGTAKLTIAAGLGCMSAAGDILIIGDGTYVESVTTASIPATGSASNRLTIRAQNRRQVIVAPGGAATRGLTVVDHYITVEGIRFNCTSSAGGDSQACISNNVTSTVGVWLLDNEFYNGPGGGMYVGGSGTTNWRIEYNSVHDNGQATDYGQSMGMYLDTIQQSVILHNEVYKNECNGIRLGKSSATSSDANNNEVAYNYIHDNGNGFTDAPLNCTSANAGIMISATGNVVHHNVVVNQSQSGIWFYNINATNPDANNVAYNNTVYNVNHYGIRVATSHTGVVYRNNHVTSAALGATFHDPGGSSVTTSNNRTTGVVTDCTPSTSSFTQKAGSLCINAGTNVGYAYNGSAPDIGAFEAIEFSTCSVESGATSTIRVTFSNNLAPPLLPATGATTFTTRRNAGANAVTGSVNRSGDGIYLIIVTNAYVGGDTTDISISTNNITDSMLMGGSINQPLVQTLTNQSCTNNAGGAPAHTLTQARYELHDVIGLEASPVILPHGYASTGAAENYANYPLRPLGQIRLRFAIVCGVANCPSTAFYLYSSTGGAYAAVPDSFGAQNVAFCGVSDAPLDVPANGSETTNQLSTAGTFVPGGIIFTSNAIPTISGLNTGFKTELEYCVKFDSDASGTISFRVFEQSGAALTAYTVTPSIVINPAAAGGM